jgi:hypothetical protein
MKLPTGLLVLLLSATPLFAQDVPLTVHGGDVKIVRIDQITIVKVKRTVVTSFPFTVDATPGGDFYFWTCPAGVVAVDKGESLEITEAPKGDLTISIKVISADWENKKFITKVGSLTFSVGDVGLAQPQPMPTPLQASLQAAYNAELDAGKVPRVAALADLLGAAVAVAKGSGTITTPQGLLDYVHNAVDLHADIGKGAIPTVRAAVGVYLNSVLPRTGAADAAFWQRAETAYQNVAITLKCVK